MAKSTDAGERTADEETDDGSASGDAPQEDQSDVESRVRETLEAIDDDGESLKSLIANVYLSHGVNSTEKNELQAAIRELLTDAISEFDDVSVAEGAAAMWGELLFISNKLEEAAAEREEEADSSDTKAEETTLETFATEQSNTGGDALLKQGDEDELKAEHDPAFH